jgi:hypothetical protein
MPALRGQERNTSGRPSRSISTLRPAAKVLNLAQITICGVKRTSNRSAVARLLVRLANCQRLIEMARHFERGACSFRAFVEKLEVDAERGEADEAPIVEEGTEGVRVMTVHKAKGLEFPVVVLADPTCNAARDTPSRHVDPHRRLWAEPLCGSAPIELLEAADEELRRDRAEAIRVAYVAATRARDILVAPVCGDQPVEGWLDVLQPVLYPPNDSRGNSDVAPGCPTFGEDSVVDRGPKGHPPAARSVRPGLHQPVADGPQVVGLPCGPRVFIVLPNARMSFHPRERQ